MGKKRRKRNRGQQSQGSGIENETGDKKPNTGSSVPDVDGEDSLPPSPPLSEVGKHPLSVCYLKLLKTKLCCPFNVRTRQKGVWSDTWRYPLSYRTKVQTRMLLLRKLAMSR